MTKKLAFELIRRNRDNGIKEIVVTEEVFEIYQAHPELQYDDVIVRLPYADCKS